MVKRQKEKQYQSAREHRANQSIRSGSSSLHSSVIRPLPFDCCALTLTPYTTPVCTSDGIIFDNAAITPHLMKYKVDPVTGRAMTSRDIIMLNMDRDESTGQWQCPVLNKPFTNRTRVVAIRQRPPGNEANVFSYEAYHELNVKAKNNVDLVSGKKFSKEDVITLQDPNNEAHCKLRDIQNFSHINSLREENTRQQNSAACSNVNHSVTASRIMEKLDREKRKRERAAEDQAKKLLKSDNDSDKSSSSGKKKEKINIFTDELLTSVNLTSGKASGSLTSTTMSITRENKARLATEEEIITSQCEQLKRLKKKGMVRMFTNRGAMDIELHCDIVPKTTMNFLQLAEEGEYDGSKFHRSIPNFMLQGGKKPGSKGNDGGTSIWGKPFADEFDDRLTHTGSGIVSMANSGPGTNGRQFFITYKSCAHLNRKHSVFGKIVGGLEILRKMEQMPTDKETDRPLDTVKIESMEILENPVNEALEIERERVQTRKKEKHLLDQSRKTPSFGRSSSGAEGARAKKPLPSPKAVKDDSQDSGPSPIVIGKYLKAAKKESKKRTKQSKSSDNGNEHVVAGGESIVSRLPPPPKKTTYDDFSG
eukprot:CAMPEP_0172313490 /NCGR_PEP_ID=MMETSP1058-20130122/20294_1 /TAXON_ID=83371 /ORGANISM="Detonula confervacea, Strain CCMP 353" /LENGTH=591 /DNA_ID=CAMNT_0013027147 /DNA_START=171 /DNA_END=1943 /DNA_ORIENTATION=+